MKDVLERVVRAGCAAPSGDNCQPWRFCIGKDHIDVYNLPDRDQSLYSWGQRASLIAHGALLENIRIAAAQEAHQAHITLFPEPSEPTLVARVRLTGTGSPDHSPLHAAIGERATNRKPYRSTPLTDAQRQELLAVPGEVGGAVRLTLIEDAKARAALGTVAAANEVILFGNRPMHSFFFSHLNWTPEEDVRKRSGMQVATLELPPPAKLMFKVFRKWDALQKLNRLGLSKLIAFGNSKIYASGAATGAIIIPDRTEMSYVDAGRVFQRIWLKTTAMGLALQPLTGVTLLMNRIVANQAQDLTEAHRTLVTDSYARAADIVGVTDEAIAFMFRIGTADKPSARTVRLTPDITWF